MANRGDLVDTRYLAAENMGFFRNFQHHTNEGTFYAAGSKNNQLDTEFLETKFARRFVIAFVSHTYMLFSII